MSHDIRFSTCAARVRAFIRLHSPASPAGERQSADESARCFNKLALALFSLQYEHIPILRRLCDHRGIAPAHVHDWRDIPALPTVAFKEFEVTSLPPEDRPAVFHSSGTSEHRPSRHFHNAESLALYEASLWPWFQAHLAADVPARPMRLMLLTPSPAFAPHSSLVHMLDTVRREFGAGTSCFFSTVNPGGAWELSIERLHAALHDATVAGHPVMLLGTAIGFLHWLDHLAANKLTHRLPAGSRVMETGGYKGRARAVPRPELHALVTKLLDIPPSHIVCEYGMSELGSQAYDLRIGDGPSAAQNSKLETPNSDRLFRFPPWACAQVISPETGREAREGETGLIRVFDLANLRSVLAIQTEDLGVRRGDGIELLGRATAAEARGCSLMAADSGG